MGSGAAKRKGATAQTENIAMAEEAIGTSQPEAFFLLALDGFSSKDQSPTPNASDEPRPERVARRVLKSSAFQRSVSIALLDP